MSAVPATVAEVGNDESRQMPNTKNVARSKALKRLEPSLRELQLDSSTDSFTKLATSPTEYFTKGNGAIASMSARMSADEERFRREWALDVQKTNRFIRSLRKPGVLNPRGSKVQVWDLLTALCLLFTAVVTPFEVCFVYDPIIPATTQQTTLLVVNQVVNGFFVADIIVNFILAYPNGSGGFERRHSKIAMRYLRSWFMLDMISVIPFDLMAIGGVFGDPDSVNKAALRLPRVMKLLRLFKLVRVLKASRIISRWESRISLTHAARTLLFWLAVIIFCMHLMGAFWGFLPQLMGSLRSYLSVDEMAQCGCSPALPISEGNSSHARLLKQKGKDSTELESDSAEDLLSLLDEDLCLSDCLTECERNLLAIKWRVTDSAVAKQEHWLCRYRAEGEVAYHYEERPFSVYLTCAYVAIQFFGGGTGIISPQNDAENLLVFVCVVFGTMLWAIFVGAVCSILTNIDESDRQYNETLECVALADACTATSLLHCPPHLPKPGLPLLCAF